MNLYVYCCDKDIHLGEIFQHLVSKYWKDQSITFLGYQAPKFQLKEQNDFISLGTDRGVQAICEDLQKFFSGIDDEYFMFNLVDGCILTEVKEVMLNDLFEDMKRLDAGKAQLTGDMQKNLPFSIVTSKAEYSIIKAVETGGWSPGTQVKLSLGPSIWKKDYLLKYMRPGWNLWEFEVNGTKLALRDGTPIIATKDKMIMHMSHLMRQGVLLPKWYEDNCGPENPGYLNMCDEDREFVLKIINKET